METLVKKNADLNDTINLIVFRVNSDYNSPFVQAVCEKLNFRDSNRLAFLKRLHNYVYNNVRYQLDELGKEKVFRPETTISQGIGDCKKQTVIIASCLKCAGIPFLLKHVYYKDQPFTHIYTVVPSNTIKGYYTIDTAENPHFDNEVNFSSSKLYNEQGKKMDLYTGKRDHNKYSYTISGAANSIMEDIEAIGNFHKMTSGREEDIIEEAFNSIGRKSKEERKANREKAKAKAKKGGLAPARLAFLALVRFNLLYMAQRMLQAYNKDKKALQKKWEGLGGNFQHLKEVIAIGAKTQLNGRYEANGIGFVAAATVAAALPVVATILEFLKGQGIHGTAEEDAKINEAIEGAEDVAANDSTYEPQAAAQKAATDAGLPKAVKEANTSVKPSVTPNGGTSVGGEIFSLSELKYEFAQIPVLTVLNILRIVFFYSFVISAVIYTSPKFLVCSLIVTAAYYINKFRKTKN